MTVEFQREKAKELVRFFKQQQAEAKFSESACVPDRSLARVAAREHRLRSAAAAACEGSTPRGGRARAARPACRTFGWTKANEIGNGRWVMFGLLVGMMTEYATGVDFPNQLKLTVSVLGIADVYD